MLIEDKKVVMADTDQVEEFDAIARDFFEQVFDMDFDEVFISDLSDLTDFVGCHVVNAEDISIFAETADYSEVSKQWKRAAIQRIEDVYHITPQSNNLVALFNQIKQSKQVH